MDAFHLVAIAAGGRDHGPPGLRPIITNRTITEPSFSTRMATMSKPFYQPTSEIELTKWQPTVSVSC